MAARRVREGDTALPLPVFLLPLAPLPTHSPLAPHTPTPTPTPTHPTHHAHKQGDDGKWNKFGGRLAWDKSAICANNPAFGGTGGYKNAEDYPAAPNVDHSQVGGRPCALCVAVWV